MRTLLKENLCRKVFAWIVVATAIANCCLCVQGILNNDLFDYSFLFAKGLNDHVYNKVNNVADTIQRSLNGPPAMHNSFTEPIEEPYEPEIYSDFLNLSEYPGEHCNRVCAQNERRLCYFKFTLELYHVMGPACGRCAEGVEEDCNRPQCIVADGVEKGVMSINRQVPGPAIQVCENDLVVVDVHNRADGTAAAIHWHGVHMKETPYMDGVPFLTQCPISYRTSFRYQFYANEPGTHFYHSHSGHHKVNGQYGALIVRRVNEPLAVLYDYDLPEHHIVISDWSHEFAENHAPGLPSLRALPESVLINSRGVFTNTTTGEHTKVRPIVYYVTPGKRYRFRLMNSVNHVCPFEMQVDKHNLTVISSDSYDILPHTTDMLVSNAGERYDFILTANQESGDFWIRVRGMGPCTARLIESYALLRYETDTRNDFQIPPFPKYAQYFPRGTYLNHPNATCWGQELLQCVTDLTAFDSDEDLIYSKPDYKFFLAFQNHPVSNDEIFQPGRYMHFSDIGRNITVVGTINKISNEFFDYPPLTQSDLIDESKFCDEANKPASCAESTVCICPHRLKVKLNSIVELIIVDETAAPSIVSHPFHLHGYKFMVTGLGLDPGGLPMTVSRAKKMENTRTLPRHYGNSRPPFKDTVSIPRLGYAIIRFRATNPGFWLMHCHYEFHLTTGMSLMLQVGEISQMVKAPANFPKCGNYLPPVRDSFNRF